MRYATFIKTIPVIMGYLPLGMAFGILYSQLNSPWYYAFIMSIIVYAGAGQFLLVALLAAHAGYIEIAIATFLINLRHIFYGLSIMEELRDFGHRRHYIMFALTDETFAMLKSSDFSKESKEQEFFHIALLNHAYWCIGSMLGVFVGAQSGFSWLGVEFSLTALFVVLTLNLLLKAPSKKPFYIALGVGMVALALFPPKYMLILSILLVIAILLLFRPFLERT
ncbi:MAG: AzlC family ABC transporter permease [Wolinella sp.]